MKSHDFAKQLLLMAKILKAGPDIELDSFETQNILHSKSKKTYVTNEDIPQALNMLVGLNQVSKQQWLSLIDEFGFSVDVRPRDANRDIFGKLLKYLTDNPSERERLIGKKGKKPISASAELADALTLLMK